MKWIDAEEGLLGKLPSGRMTERACDCHHFVVMERYGGRADGVRAIPQVIAPKRDNFSIIMEFMPVYNRFFL